MAEAPWLKVLISDPARRTIHRWAYRVRKDLGDVLTKLQKGEPVGMPDVRPMPSVARGASEIRVPTASGCYRVFYVIEGSYGIGIFHAFVKKTQRTPKREILTAKKRLNAFLQELERLSP
jgi:phage-related protein